MSGDLKDMRAYSRGYEDGRRSKDADHAAVVLKLSRLTFNGNHHENLSKIAYAVYPCATGWTCESSKGLRDRLIDLLGGVHDHCDSGRGCACGDPNPRDVGEPAKAMTYDVLGNERHKAVCELRHIRYCLRGDSTCNSLNIADAIGVKLNVGDRLHESICDRLIYLLGGDQPTLSDLYGILQDGAESESKGAESVSEMTKNAENDELDGDGTCPNDDGTCPNDSPTSSITDELLDFIDANWPTEFEDARILRETAGSVPITLLAIASRMERRFAKALISRSSELGCYKLRINQLETECDQLQAECDRLTAALDELHADPANDVICRLERERDDLRAKLEEADAAIVNWRVRERSFEESERERDQLRRSLRQIAERAGVPHDRDLSEYSDEMIANAVIEQLGQTTERDELQAKLDAIREVLDGNH